MIYKNITFFLVVITLINNVALLFLRNEVWRYNTKAFGTKGQRLRNALIPGFFYGLGLTALSIGAEYLLGKDNDHHHHDQSEKSEDH